MSILTTQARRQLRAEGLRTWVACVLLGACFTLWVLLGALSRGVFRDSQDQRLRYRIGAGQLWQPGFLATDPNTFQTGRGRIPEAWYHHAELAPVSVHQALWNHGGGHERPLLVKGISSSQKVLEIPSDLFESAGHDDLHLPILISERIAQDLGLAKGSILNLQFADSAGNGFAIAARVLDVYPERLGYAGNEAVWAPMMPLLKLLQLPLSVNYVVLGKLDLQNREGLEYHSAENLLHEAEDRLHEERTSLFNLCGIVIVLIAGLLFYSFKRLGLKKRMMELDVRYLLGQSRKQLVTMITLEGLGIALAALAFGVFLSLPILWYGAKSGWMITFHDASLGIYEGSLIYLHSSWKDFIWQGPFFVMVIALASNLAAWRSLRLFQLR